MKNPSEPLNLCLVSYRFPPQTGGGILRPLKFAKYLARQGHRVTVVTAEAGGGEPGLLRELPESIRIVRVPVQGMFRRLDRLRRSWTGGLAAAATGRALLVPLNILHSLAVPDWKNDFIQPVLEAAGREELREAQVVLATGGPWSCLLAGSGLARRLNVPLVLDYRDPWTTAPKGWPNEYGWLATRRNPSIERRLLSQATAVTVAHRSLVDALSPLGPPGLRERIHWLPNGYDPEDFEGLEHSEQVRTGSGEEPENRCFTLSYAGSLYGGRSPVPVLRSLERLSATGRIDPARVRIRIIGSQNAKVLAEIKSSRLAHRVETPGRLPHAEALRNMMESTLNILTDIAYEGPNIHTPGKLYEYLRSGRPILAMVGPGATADVIREARAGYICTPGDDRTLDATQARAYEEWSAGRPLPSPDPEVVAFYDRCRTTSRLAKVLIDAAEKPPLSAGASRASSADYSRPCP